MATSKITTASRPAALPSSSYAGQAAFSPPLAAPASTPQALEARRLRWLFTAVVMLSVAALSVSGYLSYVALTSSKILGCGSGGTFDCDHVLTSKWSTMLGVPVAAWASSLYLSVLVALLASARSATSPVPSAMRTWTWTLVTTAAVSAGLAALWFTGLQVFALKHLCPWCLAAHTCGLVLCIATLTFSPLRGQVKRICTAAASIGVAAMIAIQVMTPAPPTYTIEEFPSVISPASGEAVFEAEPELFDAPAEGEDVFNAPDVLDAPVLEAPAPEAPTVDAGAGLTPASLKQFASDAQWARGIATLWFQPASLLTVQVGSPGQAPNAAASQPVPQGEQGQPAAGQQPVTGQPAAAEERLVQLASANLKLRAHQWPIIGSPNAKHIFVELFDYTCPHCRATQQAIRGARQHFRDDLAILTLPVPLSRACNDTVTSEHPSHRESCELSRLAIAVWRVDPAKFAEYHEWLISQNPIPTAATARARAIQMVGQQALDQELAQPHAARYISKHVDIYRRMGAGPVPKLVFANTTLTGEVTSPQVLIQTIERAAGH